MNNLSINKDRGLYEGYIEFTDYDESGIWSIDYIYVSDEFGNSMDINNEEYDFKKCDIELSVTIGIDNIPPEINSITTDKDKATKGEIIKVSVDAIDDKSGVKNAVAIYKNTSTPHKKVVNLDYNKSVEKLEGYLNILDEDDSGVYQLESIYIVDNQWNGQFYDNLKSSIEIYGTEGIDYNAPEFISVSVDKNNINIGEMVKFTIKSEDDKSGVKKADIRLYNAEINKYKWINCNYNSSSGLYEGVLNISSDMVGQWQITNIYLEDNAYNWTYVYSDKYNFDNCILTILSQNNKEEVIEIKEQREENKEEAIELIEQQEEI